MHPKTFTSFIHNKTLTQDLKGYKPTLTANDMTDYAKKTYQEIAQSYKKARKRG